jgi:hypothetical protein
VLHEETLAVRAAVVGGRLRLVRRAAVAEQVALAEIEREVIGERRRRQERDLGLLAGQARRGALAQRVPLRLKFGLLRVVGRLHFLDALLRARRRGGVRRLILDGAVVGGARLVVRAPFRRRVKLALDERELAALVAGHRAQRVERVRVLPVGGRRKRVRLVGQNQIPRATEQRVVLLHVRVSSDDRAGARAARVGERRDGEVERLAGLDPIARDLVGRHDDEDIVVSGGGESLGDAEPGERLARARAVREQHAGAALLDEAAFREQHVAALQRLERGKRALDIGGVAELRSEALDFALQPEPVG